MNERMKKRTNEPTNEGLNERTEGRTDGRIQIEGNKGCELSNLNFKHFCFACRRSKNRRSHLNMEPKFWLTVAFLMSRIGVFQAASQCQTKGKSIGGMFLRDHIFKTSTVERPIGCYLMCKKEVACQSYNFVIGQKLCELNNRTKEARPEDFIPDQTRFYMKKASNRGTPPFSSFLFSFLQLSHFNCN